MLRLFIRSVQKELATERPALKDYIHGDPLLRRFFEVFLFEDLPASDRRADAVYLDEVARCDVYLGLFGNEYGFEDAEGISPTHRKFTHASQLGKPRLIFVKGADDAGKHAKMRAFLSETASPTELLTHLNLLNAGRPTHAAVLLFGRQPQRFLISSEVKCAHFHGTEVAKPIPSYQVYKGNVFQLVDQALDFVLSKINLAVGTRAASVQVPVSYELPPDAVREAIVNAVAHRDYTSTGSVQVMLFTDRLEVWNPGSLPSALTLAKLREPHGSFPANPLMAEPLYLAKYIERMGTGTRDMIRLCREAGLPEPEYAVRDGFVQTLWRPPQPESTEPTTQVTPQATPQDKALETGWLASLGDALGIPTPQATPQVAQQVAKALAAATEPVAREALQDAMQMKDREHFRQTYLEPLLVVGWLERTIPDKPTSPNQKYRLTEKGRAWLAARKPEGRQ